MLLGVVLPILAGCTAAISGTPSAPTLVPRGNQFFDGDGSLWRTPVAPGAEIDPRSAIYVAGLAGPEPTVNVRSYTVPVFAADAGTPRYRIAPTAYYAEPEATLARVPIPLNAAPDPGTDGHMVVLDETTNCVFEMYRANRSGDGWTAEWVNATPADGNGIYPDGFASRASGFSAAAGLIWPEELRAGRIDHALVFAYPKVRKSDPVAPATRSDGRVEGPDTLPEGAHLVLDPTLDLTKLGLSGPELTIATALQRYGMYLADSGRGLVLYAVHPDSFLQQDPYQGFFGEGTTYEGIGKIPFDRMQVLKLGAPVPAHRGPAAPNRCSAAAR